MTLQKNRTIIKSNSGLNKTIKMIESIRNNLDSNGSISMESYQWVMQDLRDKLMAEKIRKTLAEGKKVLVIAGAFHTQVLEKNFLDQTCSRK